MFEIFYVFHFSVTNVENALNEVQPFPPIYWFIRTPGPILASIAENDFIKSPTWKNTLTFILVSHCTHYKKSMHKFVALFSFQKSLLPLRSRTLFAMLTKILKVLQFTNSKQLPYQVYYIHLAPKLSKICVWNQMLKPNQFTITFYQNGTFVVNWNSVQEV